MKSDFLIIGSGIAGLSLALRLKNYGTVSIITKRTLSASNTYEAQGGIACVCMKQDSFQKHINDTCIAGDGLCKKKIVEIVVRQASSRIEELKSWGVRFDRGIGLEGAHSSKRILHAGDNTGREIETALINQCSPRPRLNRGSSGVSPASQCGINSAKKQSKK